MIMEGDNSKVVDILNSRVLQFGSYNWKREIQWWLNKFEDVEITWIEGKEIWLQINYRRNKFQTKICSTLIIMFLHLSLTLYTMTM